MVPTALVTSGIPGDPVLELALSHALLDAVAAARHQPVLRIFAPGPTAAFGRLDVLRPGFAAAGAQARRHGYTPVVRSAGGHAALYDERCVVLEHTTAEPDVTAGLQARFDRQARLLRDVLAELGAADARIGELPGEYCPGAQSINLDGNLKVAGIAQRAVRGAALTSAVLVVGGGADLRAAIADVYRALGIDVDPAVAGAIDERIPGMTPARVARALAAAYAREGRLEPGGLDPGLLDAARALADRHRVA